MKKKKNQSLTSVLFKDKYKPLLVTFTYLLAGILFILFSDQLLSLLIDEQEQLSKVESYINFLIIICSGLLLFSLIKSNQQKLEKARIEIQKNMDFTKQSEEIMQQHFYYDLLTKLPNRRSLDDKLHYAMNWTSATETMIGLMIFDLDRFKYSIDCLGHEVEDAILIEMATRTQSVLSQADQLFHTGGSQFSVIIQDVFDESEMKSKAKQVMTAISEPYIVNDQEIFITASMGINLFPPDGNNVRTVFNQAEAAMYRVKESGGNSFHFYTSEMSKKKGEKIDLESHLRKAVDREEFSVVYQPQIDIQTKQIIGVEALLRWDHPEKGLLLPDKFIDIAEETGLIIPIGEWVLRTVCKQSKKWVESGLPNLNVSVNLSPSQFADPKLVGTIKRILEETELTPKWLTLEVTEGTIIRNREEATAILQEIKSLGVQIALDDFGKGYSSLGYLKSFPINMLKIDRSFLQDIPNDHTDKAITIALITLAHSMNITVIAEGVETVEQLLFLQENNCNQAQGYLISHPVTVTKMTKLLEDNIDKSLQMKKGDDSESWSLIMFHPSHVSNS
jgi:diguanylate cyclase (GGDEF)-like protein